jgi:nucleotide-binding universal stress UspA family protein
MSQPVVVGIDGSPASRDALRLAIDEALARETHVRAVHVWHVPAEEYLAGFALTTEEVDNYRDRGRWLLDECVAEAAAYSAAHVEPVLVEGHSPAAVLVEESEHASLLVVGSRETHRIRDLVLGSVSHACCQQARCPVLVARPRALAPKPNRIV